MHYSYKPSNRKLFSSIIVFTILSISGCDSNIISDVFETIYEVEKEKQRQENYQQQEKRYTDSLENMPVYLKKEELARQGRYFKKYYPDEFDVMDSVYKESYDLLEEYFKDLNTELSDDDSYQTENRYVRSYIGFNNTDPELEKIYHSWIEKYPESSVAYAARGIYYKSIAWAKRGGKYIAYTEDYQIRGMREYINLSKSDLLKSIDIDEKSLMAYNGLLSLAKLTGDDLHKKEISQKGLSIFPKSLRIRSSIIFSLQPEWGGSLKEINNFIKECEAIYDQDDLRLDYFRNYLHFIKAKISKRDDRSEAIPYYDAAVGNGKHSFYLYSRGTNYYYLKQYEQALADLDAAIKISPYKNDSRLMRARTLIKSGRNEEALEDLNIALEINAFDEDYLRARGELHRTLGNNRLAEIDLTNSLVYGSAEKWNWHILAEVYLFDYKNYEKGEKIARKGLVFHPKDEFLWYDLAIAQSQLFNCEVMDTFKTFKKLCKKQKCSEQNINWIRSSEKIFKQRKFCS